MKYWYGEKVKKGFVQLNNGIRSIGNVFGNGLVVLIFFLVEVVVKEDIFWVVIFVLIVMVNGDIFVSEFGKVFGRKFRLIINLKFVNFGMNGVVLVQGEVIVFIGVLMIVFFVFLLIIYIWKMLFVVIIGGFVGVNLDSFIGVIFEEKGIIDNNFINFLVSFFGGLIGVVFFYVFEML